MISDNTTFPSLSLSAARVNVKLTQKEFAQRCGVSESTVVAWETGRSFPSVKRLATIEQVLGISLNYIRFGG